MSALHLHDIPAKPSRRSAFIDLVSRRPEIITLAILLAICVAVSIINPAFLQPSSLVDIGRASVVMGLFALGVFIILAAGGIDVSFTAIAAFTMYSMTLLVKDHVPDMPIALVLLLAMAGGALLGVVNGLLVHHLRVPSLIVTIGTQYLFRGILLAFIGTVWIMSLPPQMGAFGRMPLFQFESGDGRTITLPFYFLVLPAAALLTWWILNRTLMGRAIFALGGNASVAERLGYSLKTIHIFLFAYAGALAGLAGIIHTAANRQANPFDLVGSEINVIAAVVLGGARITGGTGSVIGTLLGVLLIVVVNSVLVMVGIPSTWQRVVVGTFILLAAGFFVFCQKKNG
ncbi:monosaccharide ABC transporter membrane protein (CUT2 family) [Ancylobacter aquaticus]|uniref:Monosaccharide ABC transporter membrane protein (CUT2 family) n=1 Tax=Ancylobacter aquaticus TaxID=100 RepID=A0A4R1HJN5_ANCAQ|nr:ABC transporter permease [Ancylobacter aquaticus]TCK19749.1 monosaccharide ABC transporter membrane protein (CUT2 family) [Ancylobacter aquaticus]